VIAVDASPYAAGLGLADRGYIIPAAVEPSFPGVLGRIIAEEEPHCIVPLVDEEIPVVYAMVGALPPPRPLVVAPASWFCRVALDKWATSGILGRAGIPTPRAWLASQAERCSFPAVIKPRDGRGSRELAYLSGPDDLVSYLARASRGAESYIVQKYVAGREYTVSVVVGLGGPTLAVVPKEVIVKRGITHVGVTRVVPDIDRLCRQIQDRLQANGPFNVQLIIADDGTPTVIEINPRYSTTVALTIAAGINEVDVVIRHALGEPIGPLAFQPNLMMVRYPTQMYVPESEWPPPTVTQWGVAVEQGAHQG